MKEIWIIILILDLVFNGFKGESGIKDLFMLFQDMTGGYFSEYDSSDNDPGSNEVVSFDEGGDLVIIVPDGQGNAGF